MDTMCSHFCANIFDFRCDDKTSDSIELNIIRICRDFIRSNIHTALKTFNTR